jgi:hypothetical protein
MIMQSSPRNFIGYLTRRAIVGLGLSGAILSLCPIRNMSAQTRTPLVRKAGLSEAIISDIRDGKRPSTLQADEAVVYDLVTELLHKRQLSDETFARAKQILGDQQVLDLAAVTGFYVMVSAVIAVGRVGIPNGAAAPMPALVK